MPHQQKTAGYLSKNNLRVRPHYTMTAPEPEALNYHYFKEPGLLTAGE